MSINTVSTSLVPYGATPKSLTPLENSFLEAGEKWDAKALKDCIDNGVDITVVDVSGNTVLHRLFNKDYHHTMDDALDIVLGHKDVSKIINVKNKKGNAPLFNLIDNISLRTSTEEVIKKLLEAGAIPDDTNANGENALYLLARSNTKYGWATPFLKIIEAVANCVDEKSLFSILGEEFPKELKSIVGDYVGTAEGRLYNLANGVFSKSPSPLVVTIHRDRTNRTEYLTACISALLLAGADPTVTVTAWDGRTLKWYGESYSESANLIEFIHGDHPRTFALLPEYSALLYQAREKFEKQRKEKLPKLFVVDLEQLRKFLSSRSYGL